MVWIRAIAHTAFACVVGGCTGVVESPLTEALPNTPDPIRMGADGRIECDESSSVPAAELAFPRVTGPAYARELRSLFGEAITSAVESEILGLPQGHPEGLYHTAVDPLSEQHVVAFHRIANAVGSAAAASPPDWIPACLTDSAGSADCRRRAFGAIGERLFRRPLNANEVDDLASIYSRGLTTSPAEGLHLVLRVVLQDARFLYHIVREADLDVSDGRATVRDHALATRLAFSLWGMGPDAQLFDRVSSGEFGGLETSSRVVREMVDDPRTEAHLEHFFSEWLHLEETLAFAYREPFLAGTSVDGVEMAMRTELLSFVSELIWRRDGRVGELFTSRIVKTDTPALAEIYGVQPGSWTELPPERAGILTRVALLASGNHTTSPILRGVRVRRNVLCTELPDPPTDAASETLGTIVRGNRSTREYWDEVVGAPSCAGCHQLINPLGYALGGFDGLGRYQELETTYDDEGVPRGTAALNTEVTLSIGRDAPARITGAVDLSERLGAAPEVHDCIARHLFRYLHGRHESAADSCAIRRAADAMLASEGTIRDGLFSLAADPDLHERTIQ